MRKKLKRHAQRRKSQHRQSMFLGLVHDVCAVLAFVISIIFAVLNFFAKYLGAPVRLMSHRIAKVFKAQIKLHPHLRFLRTHTFWGVGTGLALLAVSFALEHISNHVAWSVTVETARAAGVCPLWELVSGILKIPEELA